MRNWTRNKTNKQKNWLDVFLLVLAIASKEMKVKP